MSLLQMSVSGAIMIFIIAAIRAWAVNRLPKRTFLILWGVVCLRLLVPFSISSPLSAQTLINRQALPIQETQLAGLYNAPAVQELPADFAAPGVTLPEREAMDISPYTLIWIMGFGLCLGFFAVSYCRCRRKFGESVPVENEFLSKWKKKHKTARHMEIRLSGHIKTPLTYGIVKPVILMPKDTDWNAKTQLEYMLAHEFFHIRRFDAAAKLVLTAVLCVHWFNPLVWVMYLLANRDIELACDEAVVRTFGNAKADYARTLISMEEKKNSLTPLCNHFSKNAMEERITAIMKIKKISVAAVMAAVLLITGVSAVFATSAAPDSLSVLPDTNFTQEEYDQLLALRFDGYQNMTVDQFQEKVWSMTDTVSYKNLLERFSQDSQLYDMRGTNDIAGFLFNTLMPLIAAGHWQTWSFRNQVQAPEADPLSDSASLEYAVFLTIKEPGGLTVGEYEQARQGTMDGLQSVFGTNPDIGHQDEAGMDAAILEEIEDLKERWETSALQIAVEYDYKPSSSATLPSDHSEEKREFSPASEADYQSLLKLKTPDYQKQSVAEFNRSLLDWANEDDQRSERISVDAAANQFQASLTDEEKAFVTLTAQASGQENAKLVQSYYTGREKEDPVLGNFDLSKQANDSRRTAWASLFYQLTYHISDENKLTVEERDYALSGVINGIQRYWEDKDLDALLEMDPDQIQEDVNSIAGHYSSSLIHISFTDGQVHFESMSEPASNDSPTSSPKTN